MGGDTCRSDELDKATIHKISGKQGELAPALVDPVPLNVFSLINTLAIILNDGIVHKP